MHKERLDLWEVGVMDIELDSACGTLTHLEGEGEVAVGCGRWEGAGCGAGFGVPVTAPLKLHLA